MQRISQRAFERLQAMFHEASGIALSPQKRSLVESRLRRRVEALGLVGFDAYCDHLERAEHAAERQAAMDLLTTNETYFFREPEQFQALAGLLDARFLGRPVRIWSAACASGEEPYSLAMLLRDRRPHGGWELRASDLSERVLSRARLGVFPMKRLEHLPAGYLERFCLRGKGAYEGTLRMDAEVRRGVHFFRHNLLHDASYLGTYEIIFLRNVLIYFEQARKQEILAIMVRHLRPHGVLFVGHAESLQGIDVPLHRIGRSIYERRA